jgi:hypothetical protein
MDQRGKVCIRRLNQNNSSCGHIIIRGIVWVAQTASPPSCVLRLIKIVFQTSFVLQTFFCCSLEQGSFSAQQVCTPCDRCAQVRKRMCSTIHYTAILVAHKDCILLGLHFLSSHGSFITQKACKFRTQPCKI